MRCGGAHRLRAALRGPGSGGRPRRRVPHPAPGGAGRRPGWRRVHPGAGLLADFGRLRLCRRPVLPRPAALSRGAGEGGGAGAGAGLQVPDAGLCGPAVRHQLFRGPGHRQKPFFRLRLHGALRPVPVPLHQPLHPQRGGGGAGHGLSAPGGVGPVGPHRRGGQKALAAVFGLHRSGAQPHRQPCADGPCGGGVGACAPAQNAEPAGAGRGFRRGGGLPCGELLLLAAGAGAVHRRHLQGQRRTADPPCLQLSHPCRHL